MNLPSGKMQGMMSAQTIPAHHGKFMEGTMQHETNGPLLDTIALVITVVLVLILCSLIR